MLREPAAGMLRPLIVQAHQRGAMLVESVTAIQWGAHPWGQTAAVDIFVHAYEITPELYEVSCATHADMLIA